MEIKTVKPGKLKKETAEARGRGDSGTKRQT